MTVKKEGRNVFVYHHVCGQMSGECNWLPDVGWTCTIVLVTTMGRTCKRVVTCSSSPLLRVTTAVKVLCSVSTTVMVEVWSVFPTKGAMKPLSVVISLSIEEERSIEGEGAGRSSIDKGLRLL